jgi:hypothetical protein
MIIPLITAFDGIVNVRAEKHPTIPGVLIITKEEDQYGHTNNRVMAITRADGQTAYFRIWSRSAENAGLVNPAKMEQAMAMARSMATLAGLQSQADEATAKLEREGSIWCPYYYQVWKWAGVDLTRFDAASAKAKEAKEAQRAAEDQRRAEAAAKAAAEAAARLDQAAADFLAGKMISGVHFEALLRQHEEVPIQLIGVIRKRIVTVSESHVNAYQTKSRSPVPGSVFAAIRRLAYYLTPKEPTDPLVEKLFARSQPAEA